ncbi:ENTH-domain-containing protein [Neocallimastix lanati (nom. inval.)]|uniref:ENTH-domain-containing protein n=1 Tax=Neocallimastix californiae TaxID=1754190 RepID=A0A1Y2AVL7_9FUNG|nr:ENTH-domain-containing protein [Neocallimastix sp. JGI-2020a]ORY26633.1 ENTH-domain-containing protein [Neocallimastix californiae]|eukprot:ORY26633.1 ENTH-domain-containing protein [Neocallimastix californiae]
MATQVGKKILRQTKNVTKGYSEIQVKVRNATSNDSNCPSNQLLMEIAQASNSQIQLQEILEILDKRINDKGKNWRHVFKALSLLEYLLYNGSEYVISYAHDNIYIIKTLKEFQYIDDRGRDYGANVRQKSREISELLTNQSKLIDMRISKNNRYDNIYSYGFDSDDDVSTSNDRTNYDTNYDNREREQRERDEQFERDLQIAIELSEKEAQIEKLKREANSKNENLLDISDKTEKTPSAGNLLSFDEIPVTNNAFSFDNNFTNNAANEYLRQQQMQQQQQEQLRQQMLQQQMYQQQQQQEQLRQQMLQQQMYQQQMQQEKMRQEQLRQEQLRQQQQQQQQQQQNSESAFGSSFDGGAPAKRFLFQVIINN